MVHGDRALDKIKVSAGGEGLVSLAGVGLVALCADRVGLTEALSRAIWGMCRRRGRHDSGRVVRDLAVMLAAGGGDSVCDLAALRGQERWFGGVCSEATARRAIAWIAEEPARLRALRAARARGGGHGGSAPGPIRSRSTSTRRWWVRFGEGGRGR